MPEEKELHIEVDSWEHAAALRAIPFEERASLYLEINDLASRILKNKIADELHSTLSEVIVPEFRSRIDSGEADLLFRQLIQDRIGFKEKCVDRSQPPGPGVP
jgi:hypothetical protein